MITVVSLNPAIDKRLVITRLKKGEVNRVQTGQSWPGGKGVHVANTAALLGSKVAITGLLPADGSGAFLSELESRGISPDFVVIPGEMRTCLAIFDADDQSETELLEQGCTVDLQSFESLKVKLKRLASESSVVVFSGSLPLGIPANTYAELVGLCKELDCKPILDTSGAALRHGIAAHPFMIKPNLREAEELTGLHIDDVENSCRASHVAQAEYKIPLVVISLGEKGVAVTHTARTWIAAPPPAIAIRNTVGSGDCVVGGFAHGLDSNLPIEKIITLGVACGAASVSSEETGMIKLSLVRQLEAGIIIHAREATDSIFR
jgi:1-phosphofructokinase family hexose kinase